MVTAGLNIDETEAARNAGTLDLVRLAGLLGWTAAAVVAVGVFAGGLLLALRRGYVLAAAVLRGWTPAGR